jgi:hypothetical protein
MLGNEAIEPLLSLLSYTRSHGLSGSGLMPGPPDRRDGLNAGSCDGRSVQENFGRYGEDHKAVEKSSLAAYWCLRNFLLQVSYGQTAS